MQYYLHLNDRPFQAIKNGTKKVEGRVKKPSSKVPYEKLLPGDIITFTNGVTQEKINVEVTFLHHYKDVRSMLETERVENVLSSKATIEEGIESYHSFPGYKENIILNGIYAIGVKLI